MKKIELTQNKVAMVDDEDFEFLNQWKWFTVKGTTTFYAARRSKIINGKRKTIYMHRVIINPADGMDVDHIDHNGLNNRKVNLRKASHSQNDMNRQKQKNTSSQFKGVGWSKHNKLWIARIIYNQKNIYLGYFKNEVDAAITYNKKAIELFGEFACLNSIPKAYKNRIPVKYKAKTSSRYTGVSWSKNSQKWQARICKNKKQYHLGYFDTEDEAHQAVLKAKQ